MEIITEKNLERLKEMAGEELTRLLDISNTPTLLLVAGGSAFSILDFVDENIFSENLTIGMSDERFDADPAINNFSQFTKTEFYKRALSNTVSFIDSSVLTGESFAHYSQRFEDAIKNWLEKNLNGRVIVTFGIGPDGHTCGIMPFPENKKVFTELFEGERLAIGYDATGKNKFSFRVTITNTFLRKYVRGAVVYGVGEEKRQAFTKMLNERGDLAEIPARILCGLSQITFFTDLKK